MFEALSKYFSTYVPTFKYNSCDQSYILQEKKFQSAYLKCMSKSTLDGYTTGEHLSKISESEILQLSKKNKLDINSGISNPSNNLIHTVSAACKNIPYSDEAAKEARTKLFSIIMEVLIGWDFKEGKQGFFGIFGEVLG